MAARRSVYRAGWSDAMEVVRARIATRLAMIRGDDSWRDNQRVVDELEKLAASIDRVPASTR